MTATERLAELKRAVHAAEMKVREAEAERMKGRRAVERALGPLKEHWAAVAAGERQPDPALEQELAAAVNSAQAGVTYRPALSNGKVVDVEVVDHRAEAVLGGAKRRAEEARRALHEFARDERETLIAERLGRSKQVGARFAAAAREFLRASAAREAEGRFYRELDRLAFDGEDEDRWTGERVGDGLIAPPITVEATPEARALLEQGEIPRGCTPGPVWAQPDEPEKEDDDRALAT